MPDMTPVADKIIPPNPQQGFNSMSALLGIQQQKRALQTGEYLQQTASAESEQRQQKNQELQAAQQLAISAAKGKYTVSDGKLGRIRFAEDVSRIGPYAQAMAGDLLSQANEAVTNQQSL